MPGTRATAKRPDRQGARLHRQGEADAEQQIIDFLSQYVPKGTRPSMLATALARIGAFSSSTCPGWRPFHYRNLDVSTLKELAKRWKPEAYSSFKKAQKHTALADVHESIDELAHYRTAPAVGVS